MKPRYEDYNGNEVPIEQARVMRLEPTFDYFECRVCGFDSVQLSDFDGSDGCPLCAEDCGHWNKMSRRPATDADKPEGFDARLMP